ncbi:hypothetical protein RBA41_12750 [Massilia sp. CCM 9210]|uniref:hypothetical protein n=1 Tax=Massilia scottii TaxID=3057166 RepID=UPI002796C0D0|nr:hypothetical protein [Massilia sp. CCM 9210]MDQ1814176.1 hypothetical protein [Massilia sp. CCM 9210]
MPLQRMAKKTKTGSIILLALTQLNCTSTASIEGHCASVGYKFFHDITRAEQEFVKFSLEKKYDVLICASQGTHPPRLEFASLFASEGAYGVALLKKKLSKTTDDLTVRDISYALHEMQQLDTYDVAVDNELMAILELRIKEMKDEDWRETALRNLKRIRDKERNQA